MSGVVIVLVIVVLCVAVVNVYLSWIRPSGNMISIDKCPACPVCPVCPTVSEPGAKLASMNDNLETMVRYLTLIIKKYEAEKELYRLSHGYHQVYNSPKMEYLKKEINRMIQEIKKDDTKRSFFEKNLNGIIE